MLSIDNIFPPIVRKSNNNKWQMSECKSPIGLPVILVEDIFPLKEAVIIMTRVHAEHEEWKTCRSLKIRLRQSTHYDEESRQRGGVVVTMTPVVGKMIILHLVGKSTSTSVLWKCLLGLY